MNRLNIRRRTPRTRRIILILPKLKHIRTATTLTRTITAATARHRARRSQAAQQHARGQQAGRRGPGHFLSQTHSRVLSLTFLDQAPRSEEPGHQPHAQHTRYRPIRTRRQPRLCSQRNQVTGRKIYKFQKESPHGKPRGLGKRIKTNVEWARKTPLCRSGHSRHLRRVLR